MLNAGDAEEAVVTESAEKAVGTEIKRSSAAPAASANETSIGPVPIVDVDTASYHSAVDLYFTN